MTEQEVITYFQTHGLEIQEYNIDANGNIILRANENGNSNGPQELKDYFTNNHLFGITAIGYNGLPNSNGAKQSDNDPQLGSPPHHHKGVDIFLGTLPCHYYCNKSGVAYTTGIGRMKNPSKSSAGRRTPSTFGTTNGLSGIKVNALATTYHFLDLDPNTVSMRIHNFSEGKELRRQRFMGWTTNASDYHFCMNLIITLTKKVSRAEEQCDQPILNFILSPFVGEYNSDTLTGKYLNNAI